jgi:ankyrin repeat protein
LEFFNGFYRGKAALHHAVYNNHHKCVMFLVGLGCNPYLVSEKQIKYMEVDYKTEKLIAVAKMLRRFMVMSAYR